MSLPSPSPTYRLLVRAMEERRQVVCVYRDRPRVLQPIVLGWSDDREKLLASQLGGASSRPLTDANSRWRCMFLDDIEAPTLRDGWEQIDAAHQSGQTCVKDVDLDINPRSPFRPRRKLTWQR